MTGFYYYYYYYYYYVFCCFFSPETSDSNSRPVSGRAETPEQNGNPPEQGSSEGQKKFEAGKSSSSERSDVLAQLSLEATRISVTAVDGGKKSRASSRATLERSGSLTRSQESRASSKYYIYSSLLGIRALSVSMYSL